MISWPEFYKKKLESIDIDTYYKKVCDKYKPFIDIIKENIVPGYRSVLEAGSGLGNITKAISPLYNNYFICVDNNEEMLDMSLNHIGQDKTNVVFRYGSILDFTSYQSNNRLNVIHSHGVLEHFDDYALNNIINMQLHKFSHLVHCVPSSKYEKPSFGDERLMTPQQWKDIFPLGRQPNVIEFNDGYDLILKW